MGWSRHQHYLIGHVVYELQILGGLIRAFAHHAQIDLTVLYALHYGPGIRDVQIHLNARVVPSKLPNRQWQYVFAWCSAGS